MSYTSGDATRMPQGKYIVKCIFKLTVWGLNWIHLADDRVQRRVVVNTVRNTRGP